MKTLFIESKRKIDFNVDSLNFEVLPKKIFLAYTIQYKSLALRIKEKLGKTEGFKQVLGCSKIKTKCPILLVGSGKFHALQLALQGNIVYILENKITKLDDAEIERLMARRKSALINFLSSENVGVLVSTKPGQGNLRKAVKLKKKLGKTKKIAIFLGDTFNLSDLENFKAESWVNTACPAIALDNPKIINLEEIPK